MLALIMSLILWLLTLLLAFLVILWLFIGLIEWGAEFHREGMERVRRFNEREVK